MDCASAQSQWLKPNKRLHLSHGPIDLVIDIDAGVQETQKAFAQAKQQFSGLLELLVEDLSVLRAESGTVATTSLSSSVSQRMVYQASRFSSAFVTPMAGVAGAVADDILRSLLHQRTIRRASVNNGGDIAFYLGHGQRFRIGICDNLRSTKRVAQADIISDSAIRGVATSGWQGRSMSLGIADAVTVLAKDAVTADFAATLIANEVNLPLNYDIERDMASNLYPDSDLGDRLVTVNVPELNQHDVRMALADGQRYANALLNRGCICAAFLSLQGHFITVGDERLIDDRKTA